MASNFLNVLTGGLNQHPDWDPANLDPGTASIIQQQADLGHLSQPEIVERQLYGTNPTMDAATGGAIAQQQAAMGGNDPSVATALNDRASRMYDSQYNQLHNAAVAGAPAKQGAFMNQAANALQQQQNINDALNRQQMEVTANKTAMRNQVIKQIFGGAGQFAGTYYGAKDAQKKNAPQQGLQSNMNDSNSTPYAGPDPQSAGGGFGQGETFTAMG